MKSIYNYFTSMAMISIVLLFAQQTSFAHWTTKGPFGGSMKTLLVATTLYVGTFEGGVYRSNNTRALSWRYANYNGLGSGHINALTSAGGLVFAGTDAGIFVTANLGNSWAPANNGLTNLHVLSMITFGDKIYAGTDGGGVFVSANGGASWTASNNGLSNLKVHSR